jgi:predicted dienelactone hydrolase
MGKAARAIRNSWVLTIFGLVMTSAAGGGEIPPDQLGEMAVSHTQAIIVDTNREDRELPLEIWYPADSEAWGAATEFSFYSLLGTIGMTSTASKEDLPLPEGTVYPLIVFSHGYGGIAIQSVRLMEHLASHGFVVVAPTHTGNSQGDDTPSPNPEADRYPDVSFVIDEMAAANADALSVFFGHVDASNSGVAGHSYGGMTAMFMAAGYGGLPADPRVKAIMPIAASSATLSDSQIAGITIPTLLLVGTLDSLQSETARSFDLI